MDTHAATQRSVAPLEVRLLGGFALIRATRPLTLPVSLQRLIAFLALRGPTPRCKTAGILWPSTSDEKAMASLRTAVWRLRRTVPGLLARPPGSLGLSADVNVDVALLDRAVDMTEVADLVGRPWPDLLPGWYDDWVIMERERSRHRYLRLLESAAVAAIDRGHPDVALDWALTAAAVDPLRESAHRLVIRALLADGNVQAARRHLALVREVFREQLGLAPSHQLTALLHHVRTAARRMSSAGRTDAAVGTDRRDCTVTHPSIP